LDAAPVNASRRTLARGGDRAATVLGKEGGEGISVLNARFADDVAPASRTFAAPIAGAEQPTA
jgi:hypothetical protein